METTVKVYGYIAKATEDDDDENAGNEFYYGKVRLDV